MFRLFREMSDLANNQMIDDLKVLFLCVHVFIHVRYWSNDQRQDSAFEKCTYVSDYSSECKN